ncbi:RagB/SusD family nutrient uptake outer membrane protein [uncultured Bacteroides sp.]|uniref:RagB/SusD family nutrient uptake outer membrane protein n=1 Tax=uncultured Bacteroides sp. TaxID=162156 RepID=UPI002AA5FAF3|nr:RagB/SusD family nutrient uptake outer membrane protein [uncultured Bacteroides sp.]
MKLKTIVSSIVCTVVLASCGDMDYHEYTNYGKDYMELSYDNVSGLITNIYTKLDYDFGQNYSGGMLASACDEAEYAYTSNAICDFYNGSWSPANAKENTWTSSYAAIQLCNYYLDEFQGLTFPELALNQDYDAKMNSYNNYAYEARFLRAYFYFNLVRQYGDVPLVEHAPTTSEVNNLTRTSSKDVFAFIETECDDITDKIIADYTKLGSLALSTPETGRANRLAVIALKARTTLYEASPLFNTENSSELWHKAALANKAVLDSCAKYGKVLGKYSELWGENNWSSNEMIFMRRMYPDATNTLEGYNFPIGVEGGNSGNCPTQTLVDAYEMKVTGKLWNEEGSGYDATNPYGGRDPRFGLTIAKNGDTQWPTYNTLSLQTYYGGANGEPISGATPTSYYLKKYCDASVNLTAAKENTKRHTWITYRLGEFYLNYAEAVFKYLGSADATSNEFPMSAREAVNMIRNRSDVQMPKLITGLSNDEFWKKYENERMVELAFEGHRFWDVRRWKEGDKLKSITEMNITKNGDGTFTYIRKVVNRSWDDKMYLFPIPQSERMKNPNLSQNTGWE